MLEFDVGAMIVGLLLVIIAVWLYDVSVILRVFYLLWRLVSGGSALARQQARAAAEDLVVDHLGPPLTADYDVAADVQAVWDLYTKQGRRDRNHDARTPWLHHSGPEEFYSYLWKDACKMCRRYPYADPRLIKLWVWSRVHECELLYDTYGTRLWHCASRDAESYYRDLIWRTSHARKPQKATMGELYQYLHYPPEHELNRY